jgi:hypothetical protein
VLFEIVVWRSPMADRPVNRALPASCQIIGQPGAQWRKEPYPPGEDSFTWLRDQADPQAQALDPIYAI